MFEVQFWKRLCYLLAYNRLWLYGRYYRGVNKLAVYRRQICLTHINYGCINFITRLFSRGSDIRNVTSFRLCITVRFVTIYHLRYRSNFPVCIGSGSGRATIRRHCDLGSLRSQINSPRFRDINGSYCKC